MLCAAPLCEADLKPTGPGLRSSACPVQALVDARWPRRQELSVPHRSCLVRSSTYCKYVRMIRTEHLTRSGFNSGDGRGSNKGSSRLLFTDARLPVLALSAFARTKSRQLATGPSARPSAKQKAAREYNDFSPDTNHDLTKPSSWSAEIFCQPSPALDVGK